MVAELTCRAGVRTAGYARLGTARARDVLLPGRISWPALNQIVCALRFFYGVTLGQAAVRERIAYAREPSKLPVVLSPDEVVRFLEVVPSFKSRTAPTTVYAAGLRVSEVVLLKIPTSIASG